MALYSDYIRNLIKKAHIEIAIFSHAYIETIDGRYSRTVDYGQIVHC